MINENYAENIAKDKLMIRDKLRNGSSCKTNKISSNDLLIITQKTLNNEKTKQEKIEFDKYKYNEYELNNLDYEEAKKIDKRTYIQYYFCLLKRKQLIIFTFYTSTDYNSRLLKISLFLFSFALYITINALFFNDSTMHKIYEDQGNFNFLYNLPKILYSTIISSVINFIILFLSLIEKDIIKIKTKVEKDKINSTKKKKEKKKEKNLYLKLIQILTKKGIAK